MQIANWETMPTKSKAELGPQKQCHSLRFKCNGLLHLNRGLPKSTVYDLNTVRQLEVRGEISPRIKCSSLRFKCNSLLYLNRGLPGSAVYDLSTDRQRRSNFLNTRSDFLTVVEVPAPLATSSLLSVT